MYAHTRGIVAAACIAAACMGCSLALMAGSRIVGVIRLKPVAIETVGLAVALTVCWRAVARIAPAQAHLAMVTMALVGWGVVLALNAWPGGVDVVLYAMLWAASLALALWTLAPVRCSSCNGIARTALFVVSCLVGTFSTRSLGPLVASEVAFEGLLIVCLMICGVALAAGVAYDKRALGALDFPADCDGVPAECADPCARGTADDGAGTDAATSDFDLACLDLAEAYCLSNREREVFPYVARGHKAPYIARELGMADATARSHTRNLYRKMEVGSSEEVIQLVEEHTRCVGSSRRSERIGWVRHLERLSHVTSLRTARPVPPAKGKKPPSA